VVHGFYVVAVRVENVCAVITRVVRPLARRAVVPPARGQGGFVKSVDCLAVVGLKGDVQPCRGGHVGGDVQLVRAKGFLAFSRQLSPHRREHGAVEALARLEIATRTCT
jgi:hypothetical protein